MIDHFKKNKRTPCVADDNLSSMTSLPSLCLSPPPPPPPLLLMFSPPSPPHYLSFILSLSPFSFSPPHPQLSPLSLLCVLTFSLSLSLPPPLLCVCLSPHFFSSLAPLSVSVSPPGSLLTPPPLSSRYGLKPGLGVHPLPTPALNVSNRLAKLGSAAFATGPWEV